MFGSGCVSSFFFFLHWMTWTASRMYDLQILNFELMVENKVTEDSTVKVSSDRVHRLMHIKCEVSQLSKPQFNKYNYGLFHTERGNVIVQFSGSPLGVTLCFNVAAVFHKRFILFIAQVSFCLNLPQRKGPNRTSRSLVPDFWACGVQGHFQVWSNTVLELSPSQRKKTGGDSYLGLNSSL